MEGIFSNQQVTLQECLPGEGVQLSMFQRNRSAPAASLFSTGERIYFALDVCASTLEIQFCHVVLVPHATRTVSKRRTRGGNLTAWQLRDAALAIQTSVPQAPQLCVFDYERSLRVFLISAAQDSFQAAVEQIKYKRCNKFINDPRG